jgi:hypothetical protein
VKFVARTAEGDSTVDTLRVGVAELELLGVTTHFDLIGQKPIHPSSHWVSATMAAALREFADSLYAVTDSVTHLNDASLKFGGKFDLHRQWAADDAACIFKKRGAPDKPIPAGCHSRHRIGRDIDVRNNGFLPDSKHEKEVFRLWKKIEGTLEPVAEGDHLHFPFRKN